MKDRFGRTIDYLRISVTDRCNLRCTYCMPEDGIPLLSRTNVLSFEEIVDFTRTAVEMGVRKVRLTGGEPLVRRGVVELVRMLSDIQGIADLAMTTNGLLLADFAAPLAEAGLHRVNVSLDALDPARYARITRGGDVKRAISGIRAAVRAGLTPAKINCVILDPHLRSDADEVARFAAAEAIGVRFIHRMRLTTGEFTVVEGGSGGDCAGCTRLRLTASGELRPCLFSDLAFNIRTCGARGAIRRAVAAKPRKGTICSTSAFRSIGG